MTAYLLMVLALKMRPFRPNITSLHISVRMQPVYRKITMEVILATLVGKKAIERKSIYKMLSNTLI